MNYRLVFMFGWLILSMAFSPLSAQVVSPTLPGDTLPTINMEFEEGFILLYLLAPPSGLFIGGHSYQINGEKVSNPARLKPYFIAAGDEILLKEYKIHTDNRNIWYATTATGLVLWLVGFVQAVNSVFDSSTGGGAGAMVLLGSGGIIGGQVARVISFKKLRKAVNYYNFEYAGKRPSVGLNLGLPSTTPAGLALYLKF